MSDIKELLDIELTDKLEGKHTLKELSGKYIGLLFSAHWCPPCRQFTPKLINCYKNILAAGNKFEVIFVSGDQSKDEFLDYLNLMPWLAVPYDNESARTDLGTRFNISGVPVLIILNPDLTVRTELGRGFVLSDTMAVDFPWK